MAHFDPREQRLAIRIVYDGVAGAGKTTNLRQLSALFVAQNPTELYSPADLRGRTLYFDWMQIKAGVVCGYPLLCQVVSVPGQVVLTPRRRHLLRSADVVVYVCESQEDGAAQARAGLSLLQSVEEERGSAIPVLFQANKQDRKGAQDGARVTAMIGREGAPVVAAIASDGVGVIDTFVSAVRLAARHIQKRVETEGLRVPVRRAETASDVLATIAKEQIDPEGAAEMLLEEAQAAFMLREGTSVFAGDAAALLRATAAAAQPEPPPVSSSPPPSLRSLALPDFPSADVPTGFIWPAHTGRAIVKSLRLGEHEPTAFDPEGNVVCVARGHVVRTRRGARFPDEEAARQSLVRRARECAQLDRLLPAETVLVAQRSADGGSWIWTVQPALPTVEHLLETGGMSTDLLASYGTAVVDALRISQRNDFSVDLSPRSFGVQHGVLRYVGELLSEPLDAESAAAAVKATAETLVLAGAEAHMFLEAFERKLSRPLMRTDGP